jgi:glycosyltransferase involved in cell wall biosynthesis
MVISLVHPSRGRPEKAYITANNWIRLAGGCALEHIFSLDSSDPFVNEYKAIDKVIINDNDCVVQATNHGASVATGDILIYLSDDFECPNNWAETIKALPYSGEFMIKAHDGLQDFRSQVLTIPIMSKALYQKLGYFFYPEYKSMWVDVDLFHVCERLGVIKYHRELLFQHNHYCNGKSTKDDTYRRSDGYWNQGKEVYNRRERKGFK